MSPALYGFDRRIAITAWTQGPWGPYLPFMHPSKPGRPIHAEDTFDTHGLGYLFDALVTPPPPLVGEGGDAVVASLQREMPTVALFPSIDIRRLEGYAGLRTNRRTPGMM